MKQFNFDGYAKLLKNWVVFSQKHLYRCPEHEGLICYGTGAGTNWGMQTHLKAMSSFAVVAKLDEIDLSDSSITKEELLSETLSMLRYSLRTHLTGDFVCTDGKKWGHSWIFALGIERMFHAIELLWNDMTDADKDMLRALMISESDFILNEYPIVAGVVENNKPESNIWNGALLYRTAALYPEAPNYEAYLEKAYRFFANGISIESDENSDEIVDGRRIGDVFVGANLFDSYACNHHRYLNIGYMNICISNIAMLHFFLKSRNVKANDIIYHNLKELWRVVRTTTFDDGRLLRIGGDTRARYCYCQDYALVGWQVIEDVIGENCTGLENEWLKILEKETSVNGDGSFLSARFGYFEETSPLYYTRLESDRANAISLSIYWHQKYNLEKADAKIDKLTSWMDEYHGAAFVSSPERFASFSWRAAELPSGLLLSPSDSSMAEWRGNFTARVCGVGNKNDDEVENYYVKMFDGGFLTAGSAFCNCEEFGEGQQKEVMAKKYIAYSALPDNKSVLCLQYLKTLNRVFVKESAGIFWSIPNDIYNSRQRYFDYEKGSAYLRGGEYANRADTILLGKYLTVDNSVGIAAIEPMTLVRRGKRQVNIKGRPDSGTIYCEEICSSFRSDRFWADRGMVLVDTGFAVSLGNSEETKKMSESLFTLESDKVKSIGVVGKDGATYILVANFGDEEAQVDLSMFAGKEIFDVASSKAITCLKLFANESVLLKVN